MLPGKFTSGSADQVLFGNFAGGVTAELTGGNFWMGAVTGATVSWLNHVMHRMIQGDPQPKRNWKAYFRRLSNDLFNSSPVIDSNFEATRHYYRGGGMAVRLSSRIENALLASKEFNYVVSRLVSGKAVHLSYIISVDMTSQGAFFVGDTTLAYYTTCGLFQCQTSFSAFGGDSFSDPLDLGIEIPGPNLYTPIPGKGFAPVINMPKPYKFIPFEFSIIYDNPGYPIK